MSEDHRPHGQDTTPPVARWALRFSVSALLLYLFNATPGWLSTNPEEMAGNWPKYLAFASLTLRSLMPVPVADFIVSPWGHLTFMSVGLLLVVALNIPPHLYPWRGRPTQTPVVTAVPDTPLDSPSAPSNSFADRPGGTPPAPIVSPPVPRVVRVDLPAERTRGKVMIPVGPDHLWREFDGRTSVQAAAVLNTFIGHWLALAGPLGDVQTVYVNFALDEAYRFRPILMEFPDPPAWARLAMLDPGDPITVLGQLKAIWPHRIELDNCILLDPM